MDKGILLKNVMTPAPYFELIEDYCRGKEVLDLGFVSHNLENTESEGWVHRHIKNVASNLIGVDYMEVEVMELRKQGYDAIYADVTKPIDLDAKFDIIFVGNLIEHLSNFEGLFVNFERLLKPNGQVIIITPNPFYSEQYFYSALKNDIIVNPEHTCWIDPVTLDQLARRYSFLTVTVHYIDYNWPLSGVILNGCGRTFDILTQRWKSNNSPSALERFLTPILLFCSNTLFPNQLRRLYARFKEKKAVGEFLFIYFVGKIFEFVWKSYYNLLVVKSSINRHSMYMSVLQREKAPQSFS
jgi:SAM-dependent methyltransferase